MELGGEKDVNNINKLYIINIHKSRVTKSILFSNAKWTFKCKWTFNQIDHIPHNGKHNKFQQTKSIQIELPHPTKMPWEIHNSHSYLNKRAGQLWNNGFQTKNQKYCIVPGARWKNLEIHRHQEEYSKRLTQLVSKISLDKNLLKHFPSNLTACQNKAQGYVKEYKNIQHKVKLTISCVQSQNY